MSAFRFNTISSIAVIGAGTMGASISAAVSSLGLPIKLFDTNPQALESGLERINKIFSKLSTQTEVQKDLLALEARRSLIQPVEKFENLADIDLLIEAVNENLEIKKSVFEKLDAICKPQSIFASNTSSLSITQLAAFTKRPERVIGLHFFNPAHIMKLVEIIPGLKTDQQVVDMMLNLVKRLHKLPVKVEECASFLVNRLLGRYINEAIWTLQFGLADVETIDTAACQLLMPIGPLQLRDMNGLDIGLSVAQSNYCEYGERFMPPPLLKKMVDKGMLGKKTQAGFYTYIQGKAIEVNPIVKELIEDRSATIKQGGITNNQLAFPLPKFEPLQLFLPMINEAFIVLQEKIVAPEDIDPALRAGLGMRKGLLEFAFDFGLKNCLHKIEELNKAYGERYRPAPLLKRYVWAGVDSLLHR